MKQNINTYFFLAVASVFLILTAPQLFTEGMVMDGVLYASISRNLANGLGTFWEPFLSHGLFPKFHEHPTLALGMQSLVFRIVGDSIYVERFYSLFIFSIIGLLITLIWKQLNVNKKHGWIPLLLYFSMLKVPWACANNMLENTMTAFLLAGCLMYIKSVKSKNLIFLVASGFFIFLSMLTKGLVGLYIWSLPFFYWLFKRHTSFGKLVMHTLLLVASTMLPLLLLIKTNTEAYQSLFMYFNKQILGSVSSVKTVDHRYFIVIAVAYHSIPPLLISLVALTVAKLTKSGISLHRSQYKKALAFMFVALSGILPIMISLKQSGHYAITTYPLIAISFALIIEPSVNEILNKHKTKLIKPVAVCATTLALFALVFSTFQFGKYKYQASELLECKTIIKQIGTDQSIHLNPNIYTEWFLHGYFARYGNISLIPSPNPSFQYYLTKGTQTPGNLTNYEEVVLDTEIYKLYRQKPNQ